MVIKTEIEWLAEKELTEEEKEIIDAKKEVLGSEYTPELDQYTSIKKDAIIDFENQFIFVSTGENELCVTRLLDSDYFPVGGAVHKMTDRQYFKGNIEEIYNILKNK